MALLKLVLEDFRGAQEKNRSDHRPQQGSRAAEHSDDRDLYRDIKVQNAVGHDELEGAGIERSAERGKKCADYERAQLVAGSIDAYGAGGFLVLPDGHQVV